MGNNPLIPLTSPLRESVTNTYQNIANFGQWFGDIRQLSEQNKQLAEERNRLLAQVAELESAQRQNEQLRSQLELGTSVERKLIEAKSSGIVEKGSTKYLLLNKGSEHGLELNQIVIVNDVLVGIIEHITSQNSYVEMPISASSAIPAVIRYQDETSHGVVKAGYNLTAQLEQVLPTERLESDAVILTSGEGGVYPADLVIGRVGDIVSQRPDIFQTATVDMLWDPLDLETVFVIK